jgi:lysophospholipase L1-like esterase
MAGSKLKTLTFSVLPLLLLVLAAELGLWVFGFNYQPYRGYYSLAAVQRAGSGDFAYDRDLIWKLKADDIYSGDSASLGPRRMRTPQFEDQKKQGIKRVICIGDSGTYGYEVGFDEAWPRLLEKELYALGITAEVINAGVSGYTSLQGLRYYKRDLARLMPDLLITQFGRNDGKVIAYGTGNNKYKMGEDKNLRLPHPIIFHAFALLRNLRNFQLLWYLADKVSFYRRGLDGKMAKFRVSPEDYQRNIAELEKMQGEIGKLLALKPCRIDWIENRLKLIELYLPHSENVLDTCEVMHRAVPDRAQSLFLDDYHFNSAGNRVFARSLAREIVEKKLLE